MYLVIASEDKVMGPSKVLMATVFDNDDNLLEVWDAMPLEDKCDMRLCEVSNPNSQILRHFLENLIEQWNLQKVDLTNNVVRTINFSRLAD